jgi:hypothetical protein
MVKYKQNELTNSTSFVFKSLINLVINTIISIEQLLTINSAS